jgi:hypothetical protein
MIKRILLLSCLFLLICISCIHHRKKNDPVVNDNRITWMTVPQAEIEQYELFEPGFILENVDANPYDAGEVMVDLILTDENEFTVKIPCFFTEEYSYNKIIGEWKPTGKASWKARYTPDQPGKLQYHLLVRDHNGMFRTSSKILTVTSRPATGFIRHHTNHYLLFDNGSPFFANSFNLCIPPRNKPLDCEYFFRKWQENRMNYTRLWLAPPWGEYAYALEWTDGQFPSQRGKLGLKKYNQEVAARLDDFMQKAEQYGIYIMLCLGDERELETGIYRGENLPPSRSFWHTNPYNQVNGGPAATPLEFFILDEAKALYKNRLRYLIARWGYSTHLIIWEFWNEIDHPKWCQEWSFVDHTVAEWHREMGEYIRKNDPYHHLISTSFSHENNQPLIWNLDEMDVVQAHNYGGSGNLAVQAIEMTRELKKAFPEKPIFISEYGTDYRGYTQEGGAEEIGIHNSIWASALSGATGITQWWWWNTIDKNDLYKHYKNLGIYIEHIPWLDCKPLTLKSNLPEAFTVGLGNREKAWIWVHNSKNNWENAKYGRKVKVLEGIHILVEELPPGKYLIQEYDTYSGEYCRPKDQIFVSSPEIIIDQLGKDMAYYIEKQE